MDGAACIDSMHANLDKYSLVHAAGVLLGVNGSVAGAAHVCMDVAPCANAMVKSPPSAGSCRWQIRAPAMGNS